MKLQFVAVSETGASELLPLHPETVRVFLIMKESRAEKKTEPSSPKPSPSPAPWLAARRSSRSRAVA